MSSELILVWHDGSGREQEFVVASRFTIGRETDNDLVMAEAGLSRRHALIEHYDGLAQITDRDSRNGTFVNGERVNGTRPLRDGDVITFGSEQQLRVRLREAAGLRADSFNAARPRPEPRIQPAPRRTSALSPPLLAGLSLFVLLLGSVAAFLFFRPRPSADFDPVTPPPGSGSPVVTISPSLAPSPDNPDDVELRKIRNQVSTLMALVSNDQHSYIIPPSALKDVQAQIRQARTAPEPLSQALRELQANRATLKTEIRQHSSLSPQLVCGVALAETDGGRRNVLTAVRDADQKLEFVYQSFGTETADRALILVAAYQMGPGGVKSHPLLARLRALSAELRRPELTVWDLYEYRKIEPATYQFVIRFLAFSVIAQSPQDFGFGEVPALVF